MSLLRITGAPKAGEPYTDPRWRAEKIPGGDRQALEAAKYIHLNLNGKLIDMITCFEELVALREVDAQERSCWDACVCLIAIADWARSDIGGLMPQAVDRVNNPIVQVVWRKFEDQLGVRVYPGTSGSRWRKDEVDTTRSRILQGVTMPVVLRTVVNLVKSGQIDTDEAVLLQDVLGLTVVPKP